MRACASGGEAGVGFECGSALALARDERHEVGSERIELAVGACTARNEWVSTDASGVVFEGAVLTEEARGVVGGSLGNEVLVLCKDTQRRAGGQQAWQEGRV